MRKQMEYGEKSLLKSLNLSGQNAIVIDPKTEMVGLAERGKGMTFHNKLLLVNGIVSGMPGIGRSWNLDKEIIPSEIIKEWRKERLSKCLLDENTMVFGELGEGRLLNASFFLASKCSNWDCTYWGTDNCNNWDFPNCEECSFNVCKSCKSSKNGTC